MKQIALIGGTQHDTAIGRSLAHERGWKCDGYPVTEIVEEQNQPQHLGARTLQLRVEEIVRALPRVEYDALVVFCSSLSVAIDVDRLSDVTSLRVISPIEIYRRLADTFSRLFIIVANGQCLFGVEKIIIRATKKAELFGLSNLAIVGAIEKGLPPEAVFRRFRLDLVIELAKALDVETLVLGYTHLTTLYERIKELSSLPVIDVARELFSEVDGL